MSKILVSYSTNSGSTADVAEKIGEVLKQEGHSAEVKPIADVIDLEEYEAVIIGAPMIFGWHQTARQFVTRHQSVLSTRKVAYFACAMRLTEAPGEKLPDVPLALDPSLKASPVKNGTLSIKERFTTIGYYLKPMQKAAPNIHPISVAFFNGKLEMYRLKWWQAAFVMLVVQGVPGDYRDWDYIQSWSKEISKRM